VLQTGSEAQTGPIVTVKSLETTIDDEGFDEIQTRALKFDLGTVDGILGKAKAVLEASLKLQKQLQKRGQTREQKRASRDRFKRFCMALDLHDSWLRKWRKIGQMASRFELEHIKKLLPLCWTTWYLLANLSDREFQKLVDSGKLCRHVTAKTINEIIPPKKKQKPSKVKRHAMINIGDMDETKTRDLFGKLTALKGEFGFELTVSRSVAELISAT
jgi:hypothetical protein